MQKFSERLKYYLIGFTFGVIAVFFFFGERGCSWLPGNRVKNSIAEKSIIYGDSIKSLLECSKFTNEDIYNLLNSSGDIDFSESKTREIPKKYVFYGDNDIRVTFALHEKEEYSEIIEINAQCSTNISNQHKQILPLPKKIISSIIESNAYTYYPEAQCEMNCYGLSKADIKSFHKNATIDMEKSIPWVSTKIKNNNPEMANKLYYLKGEINGTSYDVMYEIGENRTRIKHIISNEDCNCD
ncbi:MAG TPA: hypothetical protein EYG85_11455 [Crocinitomix sp.]|nr:hypothetical protein [Crocinitomix sp.]